MIRIFQMLLLAASVVGFTGTTDEESSRGWMSGLCCRRRLSERILNTTLSQFAVDTPFLPNYFVRDADQMTPGKKKTLGVMIVKVNQEEVLAKIYGILSCKKDDMGKTRSHVRISIEPIQGGDDAQEVMSRISLRALRDIVGNEGLEKIRRDVQRRRNDEDKIELIEKHIRDLPQNTIPEVLIPFCARILLEYSSRSLPFCLRYDFNNSFFGNLFS